MKNMVRTSVVVIIILMAPSAFAQNSGRLKGKVVDAQTGEPLPSANVFIDQTTMGAATDLDGVYTINAIPPGTYTVVTSMLGYAKVQVNGVKITDKEVVVLDFPLKPEAIVGEAVVVEVEALKNTEAALLRNRQKASAVSDAISAEAISRSGSGTAAEAMEQVTGASVIDGKYVYVRGLGDRYMNTQLNGSALPSSNPDRNTVAFDLFPSKLLENIVTVKTFTPDKPGNFTGGSVDIATRSFPENFSLSFTVGSSFNTQVTLKENFLTYPGGKRDWLAFDDGTRELPTAVANSANGIPNVGAAFTNREAAYKLDRASESFNSVMAPSTKTGPLDQSYAFSIGNQTSLFGKQLGYLGSLTYSRGYSSYTGGVTGQYQLTGKVSEVEELNKLSRFDDNRSIDEVLWGGLINLSYKLSANHQLSSNYIYNRAAESSTRYQNGELPRDLAPGTFYETRTLQYTERELRSAQLSGSHLLPSVWNARLEWTGSFTNSRQQEPDLRYFSNDYTPAANTTHYNISASNYPRPAHYYRDMDEEQWEGNLNITVPFKQWQGFASSFKFGGLVSGKDRLFRERRYEFHQTSLARYNGNPQQFFSSQFLGIVDSTGGRYRFGNYIVDASESSNNYDGNQDIRAFFGMVDLPLLPALRFIGGVRYEETDILVASQNPVKEKGDLKNEDVLPSLNFVYQLSSTMNLRAAYGKTLARPTFRELAPFASFDFVGDFVFIGNPALKRTLVDNYDLRWEWFSRPGEIYAVSGFYKRFENPIERAIVSNNNEGQFQNVDEAIVYGAEFEARKRLDIISPRLANFQVGGNFSLIHSEVDIPAVELATIRDLDPNASGKRELQGQSPYILNLDFGYDNLKTGTAVSLFYNIFGERLSEVSLGGTPNIYEQPRGLLDLTLSQRVWQTITVKVSAKNLLNSDIRKVHHYKGADYISREHKLGRTLSLSLTYNVN
ncbi:TonB-dependent receptor [candidate division KSB1 bacterium]|nr:TonB-dependent receptor [candidate division KSB1 bacterium]